MGSDKHTGYGSAGEPPRTSTIEEQLSAFVDGELPHQEMELLLRRLERDDLHRRTFARYVSIGSVLRGDVSQFDSIRVGVMEVITNAEVPAAKIVPAKSGRLSLRVAGWAFIAGVCGLAVVGMQPSFTGSGPTSLAALDSVAPVITEVLTPQVAAVVVTEVAPPQVAAAQVPRRQVVDSERMTSYLASHGEHARTISWRVAEPGFTVQQARLDY
jgi:negative regulator of sigma E activity